MDVLQHWEYPTPNTKHRDLVQTLIWVKKNVQKILTCVYTKGHRDENKTYGELNRFEQLNVKCDRLAKQSLDTLHIPQINEAPFFTEGLSLWIVF